MIIYFSGTGNSRYVALSLADKLNEEAFFLPDLNPETLEYTGSTLGFVFPVYSWGVPPIVLEFIENLNRTFINKIKADSIPVWVTMTCGDETAMAPEMFINSWHRHKVEVEGVWSVIMPNNYVLLPGFDVDSDKIETEKLERVSKRIDKIAARIEEKRWNFDVIRGSMPKLKSSLVYPLFRRWGVFPKKWFWNEECISCGKCAAVCPMHNIKMVNRHPQWGENCVSCVSCYHICPVHAVQYGGFTRHKGQYFCHLKKKY